MSNHYHIVVKLTPQHTEKWSNEEVIKRWTLLFKGPLLIQRLQQHPLTTAEYDTIEEIIELWRKRLGDLSWFMKCLNEHIARAANKEDNCTGHFWESRYTSQALLTEQALLSCMAYVDLNPIRAAMETTPETSGYTSIQERIIPTTVDTVTVEHLYTADHIDNDIKEKQRTITLKPLLHFDGAIKHIEQTGIPFSYNDYLTLVDWTGRIIREDIRGYISPHLPPICSGLIAPDTLIRDNASQSLRCHHESKTQL